jgi:hypothetical protein
MKKSSTAILVAALGFFSVPAFAAPACYSPAQAQAEQLLRLHSELMVITVTCRQGSGGQDLPSAYGDFTKKNIGVLHDAEQTMISYYKANAKGNALDHLDRLRTILGNEFGQKAADMSAPAFCASYRDKVLQFDQASPADVQNEVQHMEIVERSYVKPCSTAGTVVAKKGG